MDHIIAPKLKGGDEIRIIAPSRSLELIKKNVQIIADKRFKEMGFAISFGKHVYECDNFNSSSIESRTEDLHEAFADKNVKGILTVIGGFNSNQLFRYIDWPIIEHNPKVFCGFSDITALNNAIYAKTGLVTYSGPHYSTFGQDKYYEYTFEWFKKCVIGQEPLFLIPSKYWSDDEWYLDQNKREMIRNEGYWVIKEGSAEGIILGANICTFNLLQGTEYFSSLDNSILFVEDDYESLPHTFDRDLQSLIHLSSFKGVKGLVVGRFQKKSKMTRELLAKIIGTKKELSNIPVIANVDFGHTDPKITIPIGGKMKMEISKESQMIKITTH